MRGKKRDTAPIFNRIGAIRRYKSISQEQMAMDLDIQREYLTKIECNYFTPGPKLMRRICDYLGFTLAEVFYIPDQKEYNNGHIKD